MYISLLPYTSTVRARLTVARQLKYEFGTKKIHFFINCEFLNKSKIESKAITVGKSQAICNNLILKTKKLGQLSYSLLARLYCNKGKTIRLANRLLS